jgi:hypothetical protein
MLTEEIIEPTTAESPHDDAPAHRPSRRARTGQRTASLRVRGIYLNGMIALLRNAGAPATDTGRSQPRESPSPAATLR